MPFLVQYDALAEAACESLVLDGVWPDMEPEVRYAVTCRLDTVCELASDLYFAQGIRTRIVLRPPDLAVTPMSEVWKFFLIDWWQRACPKPVSDYHYSLLQKKREKTVTFSIAEMRIKKAPVTVVLVKKLGRSDSLRRGKDGSGFSTDIPRLDDRPMPAENIRRIQLLWGQGSC